MKTYGFYLKEYEKHIRFNDVLTYCGERVNGWCFVDPAHALSAMAHDRLTPCEYCLTAYYVSLPRKKKKAMKKKSLYEPYLKTGITIGIKFPEYG